MFHLEPKYQSATTSLPLFHEKFFKNYHFFNDFFLKITVFPIKFYIYYYKYKYIISLYNIVFQQ